VRIDRSSIQFWNDAQPGSGDGVAAPASWSLQYWDQGRWNDVQNPSGYPTTTRQLHEVTFTPVTTTRLRAVMNAAPGTSTPVKYSALAVEEWSVGAVAADRYEPPTSRTLVGDAPELPETVALVYGADRVAAPVKWDAVDPASYAKTGTFTVSGTAQGYAVGRVQATVTVVGAETSPDTAAPEVAIELRGPKGAGDWYVGAVTARVTATDDRDVRSRISVGIDGGALTETADVRRVDTVVTGDGTHSVIARAADAAGNVSADATAAFRIDATAPQVSAQLDVDARSVSATATDAASGLSGLEYAIDEPTAWKPLTGAVAALDLERHVVYVRATDAAGNVSTPTATTIPRSADAPMTGNVARFATATASSASGWAPVGNVNDGSTTTNWGTWPRVGEQWVQLSWERAVRLDRAGVQFARDAADTANAGLIPPRSWVLQYRDAAGAWRDVDTDGGYGRSSDAVNEVAFAAVETTALRALMQSWGAQEGQGSAGIQEFEAWAADAPAPALVIEASASTRMIAGKAYVTATAKNNDDVAADLVFTTPYGTKTFTSVQPGKTVSVSFTSRKSSIPAGVVTVTGSATVDGAQVTETVEASYGARN
jgi:hypothetical protein